MMRLRLVLVAALLLVLASPAHAATPAPARGREVMVVTSQVDATRVGVAVLRAGGNAIDAAIAAGFALNVTQPQSTGIGGGAFVLIRLADGTAVAIDCRETAPAAATRDMYLREGVADKASLFGPLAAGTPGLLAGFALALREYGTQPLAEVLRPAIRLAEGGYAVGPYQARLLGRMQKYGLPERYPATAAIQYPPEAATSPIDTTTVFPESFNACTSRLTLSEANTSPPGLLIRSTTASTLLSSETERNSSDRVIAPTVP